jgi:hypothetical protein
MARFRKKPVVIEARQFNGQVEEVLALEMWGVPLVLCPTCGGCGEVEGEYGTKGCVCMNGLIFIKTLEGVMSAFDGDWIIKGVKGEFYPCKSDIFDATYEAVDATAPSPVAPSVDGDLNPTPLEEAAKNYAQHPRQHGDYSSLQRGFYAGVAWERVRLSALPADWPDGITLLGELMDAVGVPNDGISPPKVLWARCIARAALLSAQEVLA